MEWNVKREKPKPPPMTVELQLTTDEYRVLRGLVFCNLSGHHPLRTRLNRELRKIDRELGETPSYRRVVRIGGHADNTVPSLIAMFGEPGRLDHSRYDDGYRYLNDD